MFSPIIVQRKMADDTFKVTETTPFHPTDTPRGTMYYNLDELTSSQQGKLNALKIDTIREDNKYLAANPEIRAIIALLLRKLLRHRPIIKIHEFIARFFNRSTLDIKEEITEYLNQREKKRVSVKEERPEDMVIMQEAPEKKEFDVDLPLNIICSEECTCHHSMGWKLHHYAPFDDMSFKETEHWITPKTSKMSLVGEQSSFDISSGGISSSELAQVIDLVGADEGEVTEAPLSSKNDTLFSEQEMEHTHRNSSEQEFTTVTETEVEDQPEAHRDSVSHEQGEDV